MLLLAIQNGNKPDWTVFMARFLSRRGTLDSPEGVRRMAS